MQIVAIFLLLMFVIVISYIFLLTIFNSTNNPGLLGKFYRLINLTIPGLIWTITRKILRQRLSNKLLSFKNYVLRTNHPFVQITYIATMILGFLAFQYFIVYKQIPNKPIGSYGILLMHLLFILCFYSYYKASSTSPGAINKQNQQLYLQKYKSAYDNILFVQQTKCKTCDIIKPPRSKHCSLCNVCIPYQNHHSIWIRRCIGEKNRKWYLLLLLTHTLFLVYLSIISTMVLSVMIQNKRLFGMRLNYTSKSINNSIIMFSFFFIQNTIFCFLIALMYIFSLAMLVLDGYQLYLIQSDRTMSERIKKINLIKFLKDVMNEEAEFLEKSGGIDNLQQEIDYKEEKVKKEEFLKRKEKNIQKYNKLMGEGNQERQERGIGNLLEKLINIISQ